MQLHHAHSIIGGVGVAAAHSVPLGTGQCRFERHDALGRPRRVGPARQRQQLLHVSAILPANLGKPGIVPEVVIAIGKRQPALADRYDILVRVLVVLPDTDPEGPAYADPRQVRQQGGQRCRRLQPVDPGQFGPKWRNPQLLDPDAVHIGVVEIADLPLFAAGARLGRRRGLDHGSHRLLALVAQFVEAAPAGPVARNRGAIEPAAVHEPVEVVLGPGRAVECRGVDAQLQGGWGGGLGALRGCRGGKSEETGDDERVPAATVEHGRISVGRRERPKRTPGSTQGPPPALGCSP